MGLAEQSGDLPAFHGIDHRQRFRFIPVESRNGFPRRHLRQQHVVGMVQNGAYRLSGGELGRVRFRNEHHSRIAAVLIHRDHLAGRSQRKCVAECGNR